MAVAPVMAVLPVIFAARSVVKFVTWPWAIVGMSVAVKAAPLVTRPLES